MRGKKIEEAVVRVMNIRGESERERERKPKGDDSFDVNGAFVLCKSNSG